MEVKVLYCQSYETIIEETDKINKKGKISISMDLKATVKMSALHKSLYRFKSTYRLKYNTHQNAMILSTD